MKRYVNAPLGKRLGAFILDICTVILLATFVLIIFMEIFSKSVLMNECNETINNIQISSYLYEYSDENKTMTKVVDEEEYEIAIKNYYFEYKKDSDQYHKLMQESNLFNYENEKYVAKYTTSKEEVKTFYQETIGNAILEIKENEDYKKCSDIIINCELYSIAVSILIGYIVFIVVIPLLSKKKNTIGQKVMNLALVNSSNHEIATNTQIIFRAVIILVMEIYIATYCLGITTLVSVGFILFRKDKSSYHDLLSSTKMIDFHYVELDNQINDNSQEN